MSNQIEAQRIEAQRMEYQRMECQRAESALVGVMVKLLGTLKEEEREALEKERKALLLAYDAQAKEWSRLNWEIVRATLPLVVD